MIAHGLVFDVSDAEMRVKGGCGRAGEERGGDEGF